MLFLFHISENLLESAGVHGDVDDLCQPTRNKSGKCIIDRGRQSFRKECEGL
jgi:hypothetical protein